MRKISCPLRLDPAPTAEKYENDFCIGCQRFEQPKQGLVIASGGDLSDRDDGKNKAQHLAIDLRQLTPFSRNALEAKIHSDKVVSERVFSQTQDLCCPLIGLSSSEPAFVDSDLDSRVGGHFGQQSALTNSLNWSAEKELAQTPNYLQMEIQMEVDEEVGEHLLGRGLPADALGLPFGRHNTPLSSTSSLSSSLNISSPQSPPTMNSKMAMSIENLATDLQAHMADSLSEKEHHVRSVRLRLRNHLFSHADGFDSESQLHSQLDSISSNTTSKLGSIAQNGAEVTVDFGTGDGSTDRITQHETNFATTLLSSSKPTLSGSQGTNPISSKRHLRPGLSPWWRRQQRRPNYPQYPHLKQPKFKVNMSSSDSWLATSRSAVTTANAAVLQPLHQTRLPVVTMAGHTWTKKRAPSVADCHLDATYRRLSGQALRVTGKAEQTTSWQRLSWPPLRQPEASHSCQLCVEAPSLADKLDQLRLGQIVPESDREQSLDDCWQVKSYVYRPRSDSLLIS
ncbi:unnamed protein product [Protopolystoma xenopodis]|uniref:Uncharacterized protein n=1 Tax=Protopolystoma xenopodis TaxID=117903 RepID=A0A3S5AC65_9PLAT|nr:unnamed protein product [Protopolystoma xenopodis]